MTQVERIKQHLEQYHSITAWEAMKEYGIMRLAARVADLKALGVPIETRVVYDENRFGEKTHYAEYYVDLTMSNKDIKREFVCNLNKGLKLSRVINGGGVEYSTVEDENGFELYSCPTCEEARMLRYYKLRRI